MLYLLCFYQTRPHEFSKEELSPVYATKQDVDVTSAGLIGVMQCGLSKASNDGYLFTTDNTYEAITALLHSEFPILFQHIAAHPPHDSFEAALSTWLICIKRAGRKPGVLVFSSDKGGESPNGEDIVTALSINKQNKGNTRDTILFLGQ